MSHSDEASLSNLSVDGALRENEAQLTADLAGMRRLYKLHARLATETELKTALDEILAAACEFTHTNRGCVQLVSDDGKRLEMFAWHGYPDDSPFIEHFRYEGLKEDFDRARVQGQRFLIEDTVGYPGLDGTDAGAAAASSGVRAAQSTPLVSHEGETMGVLSTQFAQPHRPGDEELRLVDLLAWTAADFIERHRAGKALRESEERQVFLLKLSDALRPLGDPVAIQEVAARTLGGHLGADRTYYVALGEVRQVATVKQEYRRGQTPSLVGEHAFAAYGATLELLGAGGPVVFNDVEIEPKVRPSDLPAYRALGLRAFLNSPLIKNGELVCAMCVVSAEPRRWTREEIILVQEVAERTWAAVERARAEAVLRESEERQRTELERQVRERTAELRHSRDLLKATMDSSMDLIQVFEAVRDDRGEIVDFRWLLNNRRSESVYGDVRGQSLLERNPGVVAEGIFDEFKRALETGEPQQAEHHYVHEQFDGWFLQSAVKLGDGVATTTKDITAWKEAQEEVLGLRDEIAQAKLRESEERFRLLVENVHDCALFQTDPQGKVTSWNPGAERLFGYNSAEMIGSDASRLFTPEDHGVLGSELSQEMEGHRQESARWLVRKNGSKFWARWVTEPIRDESGRIRGVAKVLRDETDRMRAEEALRAQERNFNAIANLVPDLLWRSEVTGSTNWYNRRWYDYTGQTAEEAENLGWTAVIHPDDRERSRAGYADAIRTGQPLRQEHRIRGADGSYRWFLVQARPFRDEPGGTVTWFGAATDVHEERMASDSVMTSLAEKEELLKEVHHRVKNNLQVITSLLNMQARQVDSNNVLSAFDEMRNRVQSIASIHELLYRGDSFARIQLSSYARQLTPDLVRFYGLEDRVGVDIVGDNATIELERAVPYGMLLNELVSNACKHAFPEGRRGQIAITIKPDGNQIEMSVADNGKGMPPEFDYRRSSSLGLKLVRGLARQLRGSVDFRSDGGTIVTVRFPTPE